MWVYSSLSFVEHFINIYRTTFSCHKIEKHLSFVRKNVRCIYFSSSFAFHLLKYTLKRFICFAQEFIEFLCRTITLPRKEWLHFGCVSFENDIFFCSRMCFWSKCCLALFPIQCKRRKRKHFRKWDCRQEHLFSWLFPFFFPLFVVIENLCASKIVMITAAHFQQFACMRSHLALCVCLCVKVYLQMKTRLVKP